ncbi:FUSC family protein [Pandoraea pnomenusa]|uniref:FUSC family protein n=1 Tax=Pandoraea pnomenusa TaxID=93220 RepID=UPI001146902D|nr:FUSC family protein [Pandoraea pnomenusa]QDH61956.1 FUSC family protein [Pandoraea pnomenusa]
MSIAFLHPKKNALVYLVKILSGSLIVWFGLRAAGFPEPYWAMISLIIVTEPDPLQARSNFKARSINTITGAVVACAVLLIMGPGLAAMLVGITVATLAAMLVQNYPANWRLGPATVVILMSAALSGQGQGLHEELSLAMLRVIEVLVGSTVALIQSLVYGRYVKPWLMSAD